MLILKTKSLTSENPFKRETREVDDMFMDLLSVFQWYYDHAQNSEKQTLRSMLDLIILLSEQVHTSHRQAESSIDDFKIYITALEFPTRTLTGTLTKQWRNQHKKKLKKKIERKKKETKP